MELRHSGWPAGLNAPVSGGSHNHCGGEVSQHGTDMPVPALLRIIAADCPRMQAGRLHDVGGVHLPGLVGLGL